MESKIESRWQADIIFRTARFLSHEWTGYFESADEIVGRTTEEIREVVLGHPDFVARGGPDGEAPIGGWGETAPYISPKGAYIHTTLTGRYQLTIGPEDGLIEVHTTPFFRGGASRPVVAVRLAMSPLDFEWVVSQDAAPRHVGAMDYLLGGIGLALPAEWTTLAAAALAAEEAAEEAAAE